MSAGSTANEDESEHLACPICLEAPFLDPVTASCGHTLDRRCYEMLLERRSPACPVCRASLPRNLKLAVALRTWIGKVYGEEVRKRKEEPLWQELAEGLPSAEAAEYLQAHLRGNRKEISTGVQKLLVLSGARLQASKEKKFLPDASARIVHTLCEAAWLALRSSKSAVQLHLEGLSQALEELGEATHEPRKLINLFELSVVQCQLLWTELQPVVGNGNVVVKLIGDVGLNAALAATNVLRKLLCVVQERELSLPQDFAVTTFHLLVQFAEIPSKAHPKDSSPKWLSRGDVPTDCYAEISCTAPFDASKSAEAESLRAVVFHALGELASIMVSSKSDMSQLDWQRPCRELLAEVVECSMDLRAPCGLRRAAGACKTMVRVGLPAGLVDRPWVAALLAGTQRRLQHPPSTADDSTAEVLLTLLGDIFASAAKDFSKDLIGNQGCYFHLSFNLVLTALGQSVNANANRQRSLLAGGSRGLLGLIGFLTKFESADAGVGLAPHMQGTLSILERILYAAALDSEHLSVWLEILYSLLELCNNNQTAEPWNAALCHLRAAPFYQVGIARAKVEGLVVREQLFGALDLPCTMAKYSSDGLSSSSSCVFGGSMEGLQVLGSS